MCWAPCVLLIKYGDASSSLKIAKQWNGRILRFSSFVSKSLFCEVPHQMSANRKTFCSPWKQKKEETHCERKRIFLLYILYFFSGRFWNNTRDVLRNQHDVAFFCHTSTHLASTASVSQWFWPWATTKGSIMMKDKHQKLINYILCTILAEYIRPSHSHRCILASFFLCFSAVFVFSVESRTKSPEIDFAFVFSVFCFSGFWNIFGCRTIQIVFSISSLLSQLFSLQRRSHFEWLPINNEFEYFVVCSPRFASCLHFFFLRFRSGIWEWAKRDAIGRPIWSTSNGTTSEKFESNNGYY